MKQTHLIKAWRALALGAALVMSLAGLASAQVTTGSIAGSAVDETGGVLPGTTITAIHVPSGTRYETVSRGDGSFNLPGMRVGGPYSVTAALSGFQTRVTTGVFVNLGSSTDLKLSLKTQALTEEVTVTAESDPVFSSQRTGAATAVTREVIATMPTITDRIEGFARLSPQSSGGLSFAGQDNRSNNITIDGSYFNNSFGLGTSPGDRTNVAPVAMAAIEQIQVSVAPYDVRQGHFVGASVNTITRSGTNSFAGSLYYWFRDQGMVGKTAGTATINPGTFDFKKYGGWLSGPIVKNKLFFFLSAEDDSLEQPGTTWRANRGGEAVSGNVTRVLASDLDALSSFLKSSFQYETGPYQDYAHATPSRRYLGKVDYNMNDRNKFSFRYTHLDSDTDVLLSDSSSLGFGNRRTRSTGLNFQNSNYKILENIRSGVAEWNSIIGSNKANSLLVGYSKSDESRDSRGSFFPMVDILEANSVYTTFGFEPFTPNNELRYKNFQVQNNFTWNRNNHSFTFGGSLERYESENVFFPGAQSVYVYNSLADFYTDARGFLANPNRTTSPVTLARFQVRYNNIPGLDKPTQPLEVWYGSLYAQDEWQAGKNVKVTAGVRFDRPQFGDTGFQNAAADALTFRDENGASVKYESKKLPDANVQISPRVGFNWDVFGDAQTQVRGGTGLFSGPPLYVWISNQVGNTGVLTGFEQLNNTTARPFNPDPNRYKPTSVTGAPAASYELALTNADFKFPRQWRTNIAIDRRLPWDMIGTAELIYNRDVDGIYYINANQAAFNSTFTGPDSRVRFTSTAVNRINSNISSAVVLKNQNVGRSWHAAGSLEKRFRTGFLKAVYSYGESKNTVDPGSIAFGSWNNNQHTGDGNNPGTGFSGGSPGHRVFLAGSYSKEYFKLGKTTAAFFWEGNQFNTSYTFGGDINNDGGTSNDLLYVHRSTSEMSFVPYTASGRTFTAAEQAAAWDAYIAQDPYLSKRRGQYAERGGLFIPMVYRMDVSLTQELFKDLGGKRHGLEIRADVVNFMNLLNSDWGVGKRTVSNQPLIPASTAQGGSISASGAPQYTLRQFNGALMSKSFEPSATIADVYRLQLTLKYSFK
jgi:outer membrane receptor protein involved in Fe transport